MNLDHLQQTWKSYLDAYGAVAPAERERLLRQSVTDDVAFTNPNNEGCGFGELVGHIERFQQQFPGAYFESNRLIAHHGELLSEWSMFRLDGTRVATAHTFARVNEQGRLTYMAGFFESPPTR